MKDINITNPHSPINSIVQDVSRHAGIERLCSDKGLTKREYFAAMALQGILLKGTTDYIDITKSAVDFADALINELNK